MEYEVGQVVAEDSQFLEVVGWCNEHNMMLEDVEPREDGVKLFRIASTPQPNEQEQVIADATSVESRLSAIEDALAEMMGGM